MGKHVIVGVGAVGRGVARELVAAGHEVVVVSRSGRDLGRRRRAGRGMDATDAAALTAVVRGADVLYNCANPADYTQWAREWPPLAASLLQSAIDSGASYVIMGNLYGYGPVTGPITPELPLATPSANGRIRVRMWEDALAAHRAGRVRVTEVRASDFIGPESGANAHLGDRVIPRILAGQEGARVRRGRPAALVDLRARRRPDHRRARHRRPVVGTGVARADEPGAHPARGVRVDRGRRPGSRCRRSARSRAAPSAPSASRCR